MPSVFVPPFHSWATLQWLCRLLSSANPGHSQKGFDSSTLVIKRWQRLQTIDLIPRPSTQFLHDDDYPMKSIFILEDEPWSAYHKIQQLNRRGIFTHRGFYTQRLLHIEAFTRRRFHTQTLLRHRHFYTQKLLHTEAFTHRSFYTQTPLHTDAFTHRRFYTQTLLHTNTFTHRDFYTQKLLHTNTFIHRHFYPQTLLHTLDKIGSFERSIRNWVL